MDLYEMRSEIQGIQHDLLLLYRKLESLRECLNYEIGLSENVSLTLIQDGQEVILGKPIRNTEPSQEPNTGNGVEIRPKLYNRMIECGYTPESIKKIFGGNTHIMAKIAFGRQRFTDFEADKLTELFSLTDQERGVYFWKGLIKTSKGNQANAHKSKPNTKK